MDMCVEHVEEPESAAPQMVSLLLFLRISESLSSPVSSVKLLVSASYDGTVALWDLTAVSQTLVLKVINLAV